MIGISPSHPLCAKSLAVNVMWSMFVGVQVKLAIREWRHSIESVDFTQLGKRPCTGAINHCFHFIIIVNKFSTQLLCQGWKKAVPASIIWSVFISSFRNSVRLAIRKLTYAPEEPAPQPSAEVKKDFMMSSGSLRLEASLDKEVGLFLIIVARLLLLIMKKAAWANVSVATYIFICF